jgi:UDP-hydrolysing UDP-N-acetyl-D-glucosamine 2-epimerase
MHLAKGFGHTVSSIEQAGLSPTESLAWISTDADAAVQASAALASVGEALHRQNPDALLLVGDRFETAAAALAATIHRIPIIHLHGGEVTGGAMDDLLRNAITKLSHLHLVSHDEHGARVLALGESAETVHVVGAPGLDNAHRDDLASRAELERRLKCELRPPVVLVTVQPTTLATENEAQAELDSVLGAMTAVPGTYVVSLPNNDPGHDVVRTALISAAQSVNGVAVEALGDRWYWGLLKVADAMLGNSSSAIIEAPIVELPAVNVGTRQRGRLRGRNVIDVERPTPESTARALRHALDGTTRQGLRGAESPFGQGHSAEMIVSILGRWAPPNPPTKRPLELARA